MDWKLELVAVPVSDVDRAKAFYTDKVGWSFGGMTEPFVYLMTEDEEPVGAIFQSDEAGSGPIVYMATDDIDATLAKVVECGGEVLEATNIGHGVFVRDSEGQLVEILPMSYRRSLEQ